MLRDKFTITMKYIDQFFFHIIGLIYACKRPRFIKMLTEFYLISFQGIVFIDAASGVIQFANPAFCEYLGYTTLQIRGRAWYDLIHPNDLEKAREYEKTHGLKGKPFYNYTMLCRHKDGTYRFTIWTGIVSDGKYLSYIQLTDH